MLFKTKGIVLSTIKYGETSIIARIYTELFGLQSYIINGVRKPKAKISFSLLQALTVLDLVVYHKAGRDLNRIAEARANKIYHNMLTDPIKGTSAIFLAELFGKCISDPEGDDLLFNEMSLAGSVLDEQEMNMTLLISIMVRFANALGFKPVNDYSPQNSYFSYGDACFVGFASMEGFTLDQPTSKTLSDILNGDLPSCGKQMGIRLVEAMIFFYQFHLPAFGQLKSWSVLKGLLE